MTKTFTIPQPELNKALNICARALDTNNILPINSSYLFDLKPNQLEISACNMMASISTSLNLMGSDVDFKIAIPGNKLGNYIGKCKPELLVFEFEEHTIPAQDEGEFVITYSVTISSSSNPKNKCNMPCEPGGNFPVIKNTATTNLTLPAEDLMEVLFKTMFAISDNDLRPAATGLNVNIQDGKITYTSLDLQALVATYSYPLDCDLQANFIIPKKSLQIIQSLNPIGELQINVGNAIGIEFNGISIHSRLIDEKYPDYLSITPTENHIDFIISRIQLIASLKRILPFTDILKMVHVNIFDTELLLTAKNLDYQEEANESIIGQLANGDPITIGFNGEFLLSILNSLTEDNIWFSLSKSNRAVIVTGGQKHINPGKENLILLMPCNL